MLSKILRTLSQAKILTPDNHKLVLSHPFPIPLAQGLILLQKGKILTQAHFSLIIRHPSPYFLGEALLLLHQSGILTAANSEHISAHPELYPLYQVLVILDEAHILTAENFLSLIHAEHKTLLTDEAALSVWAKIPPHHLSQANYESLLNAAKQANPLRALLQATEGIIRPELNPAQSTHTSSIHRSVSISIQNLTATYGASIRHDEELPKLKDFIDRLEDSPKNTAAKRCFERLTTIHPFLTLVYVAIHDPSKCQCPLSDAKSLLVEALYEIQRGYNLNAEGIDDDQADAPICLAGSYNKIIEKLNGIHLDVDVHMITQTGASAKFPKLAQHHALLYLSSIASPANADDYQSIKILLDSLQSAENLSPIWDSIAKTVINELWDEFAEAYGHPANPAFIDLINQAKEIPLPDITVIHTQLMASIGHTHAHESSPSSGLAEAGFFSGSKQEDAPRARKLARTE